MAVIPVSFFLLNRLYALVTPHLMLTWHISREKHISIHTSQPVQEGIMFYIYTSSEYS